MSEQATLSAYGVSPAPATVRIQRMLPGPIERIWAYLTESELRGQWLATGGMDLRVGGKVELVWRNDELSGRAADRPADMPEEDRLQSTVLRLDPPRLLAFGWDGGSEVSFELEPQGGEVLLTVTHSKLPTRSMMLGVSAGWHAHLDVLAARARGTEPPPFWKTWLELKAAYDQRLP